MSETALDADLRERWRDPAVGEEKVRLATAEFESRREHGDEPVALSHLGRALQRLSEACRCSGLLVDSLKHKEAALEIWRQQEKDRAIFLVELQRALVLAELGESEESADEMKRLEVVLRGDERLEPFYLDFWLEYDGRRAALAGDRTTARARLEAALAYRTDHRAARIVAWTRAAIAVLDGGDDQV